MEDGLESVVDGLESVECGDGHWPDGVVGATSRCTDCVTCEMVRLVTSSCGYPKFSLWPLTNASSSETTSAGNNWVMVHACVLA